MIQNAPTYRSEPIVMPPQVAYQPPTTTSKSLSSEQALIDQAYAVEQSDDSTWLGSIVGKIWNGVNTVVGLAWGLIGYMGGATVSRGNNALQFENHPLVSSAITLGNTISYGQDMGPNAPRPESDQYSVGTHERQHTYQGELLGPLYLLSNLAGGLIASLFQFDWHGSLNWNERGPQAQRPRPW